MTEEGTDANRSASVEEYRLLAFAFRARIQLELPPSKNQTSVPRLVMKDSVFAPASISPELRFLNLIPTPAVGSV